MVASKMISFTRIKDGERGFDGPYIYPIGEFNPSIIVTRDELSTPFVTFGGEYYLLNAMKSKQGQTPAQSVAVDDKTWIQMDGFEYVFIKTAYIKYGQMGSFVFYNEYMFSKHGMIGNTASQDFTQFPNGSFVPNLVLNGITGELIANNAKIQGEINATSGTFSGELKSVTGSFKELYSTDNQGNKGGRMYFFPDGFGFSGNVNYYNKIISHNSISLAGPDSSVYGGAIYAQQGFGHSTLVTLLIKGSTASFYPRGMGYEAYRADFTLVKNNKAYSIPISRSFKRGPQTLQEFLPIDLIVFVGESAGDYALESGIEGKQVTIVNASNSMHYLYDFNNTRKVSTNEIFYAIYLGKFLTGNSTDGNGKGWIMSYMNR